MTTSLHAQQIYFPKADQGDTALWEKIMPQIAEQVLMQYKPGPDQKKYFSDLWVAQLVSDKYADAAATITELRKLHKNGEIKYRELLFLQYELYARARVKEVAGEQNFAAAFSQLFRETFKDLDDKAALYVSTAFTTLSGIDELRNNCQHLHLRSLIGKQHNLP
jgi:hypothetical protein